MNAVEILEADLNRPDHQGAVLALVDAYARDPMANGAPLSDEARRGLIPGLREHPTALVFLAYLEGRPVGVAVCFRGFSTFAAKPLVNVHDLAVLPECRGRGVGRGLLRAVEQWARAAGCCKLTLEVLENNHRARTLYASTGFGQLTYQAAAGGALFLAKTLA